MGTDSTAEPDAPFSGDVRAAPGYNFKFPAVSKKSKQNPLGSGVQPFLPGAPQTYHTSASPRTPGIGRLGDANLKAEREDTGIYALDNLGLFGTVAGGVTTAASLVATALGGGIPLAATAGASLLARGADYLAGTGRTVSKAIASSTRKREMTPWHPEWRGRRARAADPGGGESGDEARLPRTMAPVAAVQQKRPEAVPASTQVASLSDPEENRRRLLGARRAATKSMMSGRNLGRGYLRA